MFERYTERARRVIFFARYEASQFGSTTIETEHFLKGLLREDRTLTKRLSGKDSARSIRDEIEEHTTVREKVSTSIDLPLSMECKRILAYAAEESKRLNHGSIGCEHLLLGILREEKAVASQILRKHGMDLYAIREQLARQPLSDIFPMVSADLPANGCVPDRETAMRVAEAIWTSIYGLEAVREQNNFQTDLTDDIWTITGSPPAQTTGRLVAVIHRRDCSVLKISREEAG